MSSKSRFGTQHILAAKARSGALNMALDEALLEAAKPLQAPTLRLYDWQPATISLGRFQYLTEHEQASFDQFCAAQGFDLVRRATGGGAILHHREITYALVCPLDHAFLTDGREAIYRRVHQAWIAALSACFPSGPKLQLMEELRPSEEAINGKALLCFARRTAFDVVAEDRAFFRESLQGRTPVEWSGSGEFGGLQKVIGSAQRRSKFALLQHGSVKIASSLEGAWTLPVAPDVGFDFQALATRLLPILVRELGFDVPSGQSEPSRAILDAAEAIAEGKYGSKSWTKGAKVHRDKDQAIVVSEITSQQD